MPSAPTGRRRVVITGMGCVSTFGDSVDAFWGALAAGRCGIEVMDRPRDDWLTDRKGNKPRWQGAEVPELNFEDRGFGVAAAMLDRFSQFAVVAAAEAFAQSGELTAHYQDRCAVILGTSVGGDAARNAASYRLYDRRLRPTPLTIPQAMANASVSWVTQVFGFRGPSITVSSACASSSQAAGLALDMIRCGRVDAAVVGGSETLPSYSLYRSWEQLRVLSAMPCRPFHRRRDGTSLGEGGGVVVLEELDAARRRGAPIVAEVLGHGMSADASDILRPEVEGMAAAMRGALADAGIEPSQVDYLNAHGTGTEINDITETEAVLRVFGDHAGRLPVSATKSMHGHALGAAGVLELIATVSALRHGLLPPTAHLDDPDPKCALEHVACEARPSNARIALSNAFGFGGINSSLVVARAP